MVRALERAFIRDAAVVSAVSPGIAKALDDIYHLAAPSLVVRNTPPFEAARFRPTCTQVRVLYHGLIAPGRGLEAVIESVALWRPEFDLTIRGPGDAAYLQQLQRLAEQQEINHRVSFAAPIPMTTLVRAATDFDIGLFALPGNSRHNELALPNKFFEYVMAGLALCVTDLPEMGQLIRRHELGRTFARATPAEIAAAINASDRTQLDQYKRNALAAAAELCWERESERLIAAYTAALHRTAA
jgi:glycosyltransferase involved in cell wall biosynthesis